MILKLLLIVPAHRKNSESYQHDARIVSATPTHSRYCWLHTRTVNTKSSIRNVLLVTSSDRTSGSPVTPCDGTSMAAKKGDWITFSGGISVGDSTTRSSRPTYSIGSFACGALLFGSNQCHHSMPLPNAMHRALYSYLFQVKANTPSDCSFATSFGTTENHVVSFSFSCRMALLACESALVVALCVPFSGAMSNAVERIWIGYGHIDCTSTRTKHSYSRVTSELVARSLKEHAHSLARPLSLSLVHTSSAIRVAPPAESAADANDDEKNPQRAEIGRITGLVIMCDVVMPLPAAL
jgi:hypothetical protein